MSEDLSAEERKALAQAVWWTLSEDQPRTFDGTLLIAAVEAILTARLDSRDARLAAVEALADEWDRRALARRHTGQDSPAHAASELRAALHPEPTP